MSHISCPLCGINTPRTTFEKTLLSELDDIEAVSYSGLGRGRGFAVSGRESVLDDEELVDAVAARCRAILSLIEETV